MINMQHVYEFCNQLRMCYNAGFTQTPMYKGVKIVGEFYTHSGQLLSIVLTVYKNKIDVRIYDATKRLIFVDNITDNINMNSRLINFIQRSVMLY